MTQGVQKWFIVWWAFTDWKKTSLFWKEDKIQSLWNDSSNSGEVTLAVLKFSSSINEGPEFKCSCLLPALLSNQFHPLSSSRHVPALTSRTGLCGRKGKTFPVSKLLFTIRYQTAQFTWGLSIYDQLLWGAQHCSDSCTCASEGSFAQPCLQSPCQVAYLVPHWFKFKTPHEWHD